MPTITLHALPPSHPCMTVREALRLKGLEFEEVSLPIGKHPEEMAKVYGEGNTTVPGAVIDGEPVHGSRAIIARLDELVAEPKLLVDDEVREAERWGDDELQDLGRRLPWGALHFRPEAMSLIGGATEPLDPAGTDYAMRFVRASWKYHGLTCVQLHEDLQGLPAKLDHIDQLAADGTILGDAPNAADLQIGATIKVLMLVGDLLPMLAGRPAEQVATRWFDANPGIVPAGAFPAGWVPVR